MSGLELWWLGQSGFRLRDLDKGVVLFIDPYLSDHEGRTWSAPVGLEDLSQADVILCTHEHIDHFDQPALKAANAIPGSHFTLVVPTPIVDEALKLGIPKERVIGAQPGDAIEIAGASIHPVPACHGENVSDAYNFGEALSNGLVRYLGYVVELGGVSLYHAGDTIPYNGQERVLRELNPCLALLPINGRDYYREKERNIVGNMNPREAATLAAEAGVRVLVPMHWELFTFNRGFPEDLVAYMAQYTPQVSALVFGRGQKVVMRC